MKIIFVSNYLPKTALLENAYLENVVSSSAIQKFNGMIVDGIIKNDINDFCSISYPSINRTNYKKIIFKKIEGKKPFNYIVVKTINLPFLKNASIYRNIKKEIKKQIDKDECVILLDALNPTSMIATIKIANKLKIKVVGIITDVNGIRAKISTEKHSFKTYLAYKYGFKYQQKCDGYIFLTKQMNEIINVKNKPYCVVEGMCDQTSSSEEKPHIKDKIIMYAGSLHKIYGINMLVEAFLECNFKDVILDIYGDGDYADELKKIVSVHDNIRYSGLVDNSLIVKKEKEAFLMVNPRPTDEKFTLYSFPSKTIEYMASGTPFLSSKLAGIPEEYFDYIYLFDEVSVNGIRNTLINIFSTPEDELYLKGQMAKRFVIENKNNKIQTKKIIDLFDRL